MATFGSMQTWVSKRLQDPDQTAVSASDVADLINQAIDYWQNTRFWFNEVTDETVLTQGDPTIPLPLDFLAPSVDNCFVIEYSGIRYPLKKVSEIDYNALYLSNGVGQPWWFCRQANSEYQVYPIPDRDYTLRRFYLRDYDQLSASDDENDFTDKATNLIQYTAAAYGSRDFREDLSMFDSFWTQAQRELQSLLVTTRKQNAKGTMTVYSPLLTY